MDRVFSYVKLFFNKEDYGNLKPEEIEISIPCDSIECREGDVNCQKIKRLCKRVIIKNDTKYIEIELKKTDGSKFSKLIQSNTQYLNEKYPESLSFGGNSRKNIYTRSRKMNTYKKTRKNKKISKTRKYRNKKI